MSDRDEILEAAALEIEAPSLLDIVGILSRTKKGQREYELRHKAILDTRRRCAEIIRAMKSGRGLDPMTQLRRIAELEPGSRNHDLHLVDAGPLAWKGLVNIECRLRCNGNSVPPETHYEITLTEDGKAALAAQSN